MKKNHNCNTAFYQRTCELFGNTTQQKLSDLIGIAQGKISDILGYRSLPLNYENKQPSAEMVVKISKAFNVSTDYLLGLTDVKTTDNASKELCATLGLSEDVINVLQGGGTSRLYEKYRTNEQLLNAQSLYENSYGVDITEFYVCRHTEEIKQIINELVEDYIYKHNNGGQSLLHYLIDLQNAKIDLYNNRMRLWIDGNNEPISADHFAITGENWVKEYRHEEVIIDSVINDIISELTRSKRAFIEEYQEYIINERTATMEELKDDET